MTLNIIHDNRRTERYAALMNELYMQGISDYYIWEAVIDEPTVVASINQSHKKIVRMAADSNLPEVCIAEDDLMFSATGAWQYFLDNKPKSFDLYLGCNYSIPINQTKDITGFHLYVVHQKFYDAFLNVPDDVHIDTAMNEIDGDYRFCYPYPALQRPGFSANNMAMSNYNSILRPEDIYGKVRDI